MIEYVYTLLSSPIPRAAAVYRSGSEKQNSRGNTLFWEQRKCSDFIKLVGGATPSKANKDYWNGDIVWLSSQEIKGGFVSKGTYNITQKAVDDNTTKNAIFVLTDISILVVNWLHI